MLHRGLRERALKQLTFAVGARYAYWREWRPIATRVCCNVGLFAGIRAAHQTLRAILLYTSFIRSLVRIGHRACPLVCDLGGPAFNRLCCRADSARRAPRSAEPSCVKSSAALRCDAP